MVKNINFLDLKNGQKLEDFFGDICKIDFLEKNKKNSFLEKISIYKKIKNNEISIEVLNELYRNLNFGLEIKDGNLWTIEKKLKNEIENFLEKDFPNENIDIIIFCLENDFGFFIYEIIKSYINNGYKIHGISNQKEIIFEKDNILYLLDNSKNNLKEIKNKNQINKKVENILENIKIEDQLFPFILFLFLKYLNS